MTREDLYKELDLIQNCIDKASHNSFVIKGWTITLIAVILALFPEKFNRQFLAVIVIVSTVALWYLDAFFLKVDRLYRWKYDWVIKNRPRNQENMFNLDPYNVAMLGQNRKGNNRRVPCVVSVMFSWTLIIFYVPILIISLICLFCIVPFSEQTTAYLIQLSI